MAVNVNSRRHRHSRKRFPDRAPREWPFNWKITMNEIELKIVVAPKDFKKVVIVCDSHLQGGSGYMLDKNGCVCSRFFIGKEVPNICTCKYDRSMEEDIECHNCPVYEWSGPHEEIINGGAS